MPDTGGMKLSVGIGLNLTGFEALTQIAKELEALQQMALKTEQSFRAMGAALRQSIRMGTTEMDRAAERIERTSRSPRTTAAVPASPIMGTREERFAANYENTDINLRSRAQARALRESEQAILRETETRNKAWNNLKTGIMGGVGITAAFEVANLARRAVAASADFDSRLSAMRSSGFTGDQINDIVGKAVHAFIPGMNLTDKTLLGQEIGNVIGRENVTPEAMQGLATVARSVSNMTGDKDMQGILANVTRGSEELGAVDQRTGKLSGSRLTDNAVAFQNIIGLGGGKLITADQLQHTFMMAQGQLRNLDVAHDPHLQAQIRRCPGEHEEQDWVLRFERRWVR